MEAKRSAPIHVRLNFFLFVFLVLLSAATLALSSGGFIVDFKRLGFSIFSTLQSGVSAAVSGVKQAAGAAKELVRLKQEYDRLVERLEKYEDFQRTNAELIAENERLREQLGFPGGYREKYRNYSAMIIARGPDEHYSSITINKGSVQGIRKNMPVIAVQNGEVGLVGKIVSVGRGTSMVMPIYNSDYHVSARIKSPENRLNAGEIGLVTGGEVPDAPLSMSYIKKRALDEGNLHYGDIVVTSGETDNYLGGIPVGSISKITTVSYDPSSLKIELTPIIDFSRLEIVLVVDVKSPFDDGEDS
jgi:rod shape-determining protein MreC